MSTSHKGKVRLQVFTADEATAIDVLDGQFHVVAHSLGHLDQWFDPGIYKIQVRAGYAMQEELVVLSPDRRSLTKRFAPLRFASPVPLANTAQTNAQHTAAASAESRRIHVRNGEGSQIFVFARRWRAPEQTSALPAAPSHPARGLMLIDRQGDLVADLHTQSVSDLSGEPWAACTVAVTPGLYRLQLVTPAGATLEQTIVASPGWQTQLFLLQRAYGPGPDDERADLPGAAILLARSNGAEPDQALYMGFDANSQGMRLAELARLGLTNQRQARRQEVNAMLWEKYNNPMLGIFGAHLLLLDPKPDLSQLHSVVTNLRRVLGPLPHPDVEALALRLGAEESNYLFDLPPMLRRSWSLVLNATVTRPHLVPLDSLAAQVANRLWGEEPWLMWMNLPEVSATRSLRPSRPTRGEPTDDLETALMTQLAVLGKAPTGTTRGLESASTKGALAMSAPASEIDDETVRQLTQTLGLPRANIEELLKKVGY